MDRDFTTKIPRVGVKKSQKARQKIVRLEVMAPGCQKLFQVPASLFGEETKTHGRPTSQLDEYKSLICIVLCCFAKTMV